MFDQWKIISELNRLHEQAIMNDMPPVAARNFASGTIYDQLDAIIRPWKDHKADEEAKVKRAKQT